MVSLVSQCPRTEAEKEAGLRLWVSPVSLKADRRMTVIERNRREERKKDDQLLLKEARGLAKRLTIFKQRVLDDVTGEGEKRASKKS